MREVTTDGRGRASGAIWIDGEGAEHHQRARLVVLCANGIGTPRLLLMSGGAEGVVHMNSDRCLDG